MSWYKSQSEAFAKIIVLQFLDYQRKNYDKNCSGDQ